MLIIHYLNKSRAQRLLWLLEELEVPYEIKLYERGPDYLAPASLKAVHPLGKSPVIEDDGVVIAESGAIFEYLIEKYGHGRLVPLPGTPERLRYTYWLHYAEGSAMPLLVMKLIFNNIPMRVPFFLKPFARMICGGVAAKLIDPQLRDNVALWEKELSRDGWFAGREFTAADIIMSFPVEQLSNRGGSVSGMPAIQSYVEAIRQRPGYQAAKKRVPAE